MSGNYVKVFLRPTRVSSQGWRRLKKVHHLLSSRRCFILTCCFSGTLILPHVQSILDLVRRCLADDERSDTLMRLSYGLIGDLADSFPAGQLKQLLLQNWIASELRSKHRMPDETKKTMRWSREVCISRLLIILPSSCYFYYRWWKSLPSRTCSIFHHLLFLTFSLLFLSHHVLPLSICLKFLTFIFFSSFFLSFLLTVPSMHAIYISRFSFTIAISRRHIIKSRLACNIKEWTYCRPAALTITTFFVISLLLVFIYIDNHTFIPSFFFQTLACILFTNKFLLVLKSGFHIQSILSPHLFFSIAF